MGTMASQITRLTIFYSTVYSGADQRNHQIPASRAFVWGIHRWPVNSPHKWPVTRKMFPFDDVIMLLFQTTSHSIYFMYIRHAHPQTYCPRLMPGITQYVTYFTRNLTYTEQHYQMLNKMADILHTTFWKAFSGMKIMIFWLKIHWSLLLKSQLTMRQHWLG